MAWAAQNRNAFRCAQHFLDDFRGPAKGADLQALGQTDDRVVERYILEANQSGTEINRWNGADAQVGILQSLVWIGRQKNPIGNRNSRKESYILALLLKKDSIVFAGAPESNLMRRLPGQHDRNGRSPGPISQYRYIRHNRSFRPAFIV